MKDKEIEIDLAMLCDIDLGMLAEHSIIELARRQNRRASTICGLLHGELIRRELGPGVRPN